MHNSLSRRLNHLEQKRPITFIYPAMRPCFYSQVIIKTFPPKILSLFPFLWVKVSFKLLNAEGGTRTPTHPQKTFKKQYTLTCWQKIGKD
ncbi:MAG TPA: hypothetical protein DCY12_10520 [Candidatus Atribacteria bacterium]|nr:hypothetical protein [Candidatus Atribacteria bacterium]